MQITVFGASGKVGRLVVAEALQHGHTVVAFVHQNNPFDNTPHVRIVRGVLHDPQNIRQAIEGSEAIISTLSSWKSKEKNVLASGMQTIIPAMQAAGIDRIISLTGSDARADGDDLGLIHRLSYPILQLVGRKVLNDAEMHIRLLETSNLAWTVLRSPVMNNFGSPLNSRLSSTRPLPWQTVNRQSVAKQLITIVEDSSYTRQAPYIKRQ